LKASRGNRVGKKDRSAAVGQRILGDDKQKVPVGNQKTPDLRKSHKKCEASKKIICRSSELGGGETMRRYRRGGIAKEKRARGTEGDARGKRKMNLRGFKRGNAQSEASKVRMTSRRKGGSSQR